jgi:ribosomal protein L5
VVLITNVGMLLKTKIMNYSLQLSFPPLTAKPCSVGLQSASLRDRHSAITDLGAVNRFGSKSACRRFVGGVHNRLQRGLAYQNASETPTASGANINRFQQHYEDVLFYDLATKLNLNNSEEIPSIVKIIISSSVNFQPKQTRGMVQESYSIKKTSKKGKKSNKNAESSVGLKRTGLAKSKAALPLDIPSQVQSALILLTGQKPEERLFRVSRPGLNVREGRLAAFRVTLRKKSTYFFFRTTN